MERQNPVLLGIWADLHTNSTCGLCAPRVPLDGGGYYTPSRSQRWMWRCYLDTIEQMRAWADAENARCLAIINGDTTDGAQHHGNRQFITMNEAVMVDAAVEVVRHIYKFTDRLVVVRGTEAHDGPSADRAETIASELGAIPSPEGCRSWWKIETEINGVVLDIAHTGKLGRRDTVYNPLTKTAIQLRENYPTARHIIAIRSHLHCYRAITAIDLRTTVISTPGWQMPTAFVYRIDPTSKPRDIGAVGILIRTDGLCEIREFLFRPKMRLAALL